jgi:hypothetical protein
MDTFELQKRMATVLPKGWQMSQTKAEQPTTTYGGSSTRSWPRPPAA